MEGKGPELAHIIHKEKFMKKLLFGFALVAMLLAVGCKNGDSWGDDDKKATEIKLTDGEWEYESSNSYKRLASNCGVRYGIDISKLDGFYEYDGEESISFTVSNGKVTVTSYKESATASLPSGVDTTALQATITTWNAYANKGQEYTCSGTTVKYKYDRPEGALPKDVPVDTFVDELDLSGAYTNADGTKFRYYYKWTDDVEEGEYEQTLVKQ